MKTFLTPASSLRSKTFILGYVPCIEPRCYGRLTTSPNQSTQQHSQNPEKMALGRRGSKALAIRNDRFASRTTALKNRSKSPISITWQTISTDAACSLNPGSNQIQTRVLEKRHPVILNNFLATCSRHETTFAQTPGGR